MKRFIIAAVTATTLNTVSAESCASNFSGFYVGIQAGANTTRTGYDDRIREIAKDKKITKSSTSFLGGFFAGYGMNIGSPAYIGVEGYFNFVDIDTRLSYKKGENTLKHQSDSVFGGVGGKVRFGYVMSPQTLIFLGLGGEFVPTVLKYYKKDTEIFKKSATLSSFAPSIGAEMFLIKNVFIRGEYVCLLGCIQKFKINDNESFKVKTNQHRFTLGLGYKF